MARIAPIAAADLPNVADLVPLRMLRGKPTVKKLAAFATGMAKTAEEYPGVFTAACLLTDLIAQLTAATDAIANAIGERTSRRGRRGGDTAASSSS